MALSTIDQSGLSAPLTLTLPVVATTMGVGGATPSGSGSGITFPATQSASSDANTLDDYEEGTWTPADGSGAGLSFTIETPATYTKVGRLVTVSFGIIWPSTANTSSVNISGLPFTSATYYFGGSFGQIEYTTPTTMAASGNSLNFYTFGNSGVTNANMSGKRARGTVTYFV